LALPPETYSVFPSGDHAIPNHADLSPILCTASWVFASITTRPCGLNPECNAMIDLPSGDATTFSTMSSVTMARPAGVIFQPFGRS
jgi:hypothetical protein